MASLKTRLVFLFTGKLPQRDKEIDVLECFYREVESENMIMNRFFWKLYEMAVTAQDLEVLAKAAERLGKLYSDETGFGYQSFADVIETELSEEDGDNGADTDTE